VTAIALLATDHSPTITPTTEVEATADDPESRTLYSDPAVKVVLIECERLNLVGSHAALYSAFENVIRNALAYTAAYLTGQTAGREFGGGDFVPESSRRARGFATWAALRSLGRSGVTDLVDRCCEIARLFAERLDALDGVEVVNSVVLNQVLFRVGHAELTDRLERAIQEDGTAWLGGTTWRGERLLRIAVSNWSTTADDVDRVVATIARLRSELIAS